MDFSLTPDQQNIREAILKHCARFPDEYWLERDREGVFPHDFYKSLVEAGWLGMQCRPNSGVGLGITEAAVMMQAIAESGACMSGASSIHLPVFGLQPVVLFGTQAQKERMLPPVVRGEDKVCFAVTEPNTGLNTTELKNPRGTARRRLPGKRREDLDLTAQVANKMLLLARTTPLEQVKRKTEGLSLFYTSLDRSRIDVRLIHKMGRHAVDSNLLFHPGPVDPGRGPDRRGRGRVQAHPARPQPGARPWSPRSDRHRRVAISAAARYARERIVFNRPIGMNQGIQHPLAKCWAQLEAANLMVMKAATLFDQGRECGVEANAGKYLAGEFGFEACHTAMLTLGGMGYAQEYHVERYLRESLIPRTAPISPHMILNFLAEKVLELPRSY